MKFDYLLVLLLCLPFVFASTDKTILTISNCYNVSVRTTLINGNFTPVYFKDCSNPSSNFWVCDCHNIVGDYNLTLQTSDVYISSERLYRVNVNYSTYDISNFNSKFLVQDHGEFVNILGVDTSDLGKNVVVVTEPVYINNTVYVDRFVNSTVDRIVYINRTVEVKVNSSNIVNDSSWSNADYFIVALLIISIVLFSYCIYIWRFNND